MGEQMKQIGVFLVLFLMLFPTVALAQRPTPTPIPTSTTVAPTRMVATITPTRTPVPPTATKAPPTPTRVTVKAPPSNTLPATFRLYSRAGVLITNTLTLGVRVVDANGNGLNGFNVSIEVCTSGTTLPCNTWESKVDGVTSAYANPMLSTSEDGWIIAPTFNNNLFRVTCGTSTQTPFVDGNTSAIVVTCVQSPTGVVISSIETFVEQNDVWQQLVVLGILSVIGSGFVLYLSRK